MQDFSKDPVPSLQPKGSAATTLGWIIVVMAWLTVPMCMSGASSHDDGTQQASAVLWFASAIGSVFLMIHSMVRGSEMTGLQSMIAGVGLVAAFWAGIKHSSMTHGRQLLLRRRPVMPTRNRPSPPSDDRQALAASLWISNADAEWVSVAAFSKLSFELLELGAPPDLVAECHTAALDEIAHTQLCFDVAAGLHPSAVGVAVAPIPALSGLRSGQRPGQTRLVDVAIESLVQGAFLERVSAELARRLGERCTPGPIQAALSRIYVEEGRHADHAFRILQWCLNQAPDLWTPQLERALAESGAQTPDPSGAAADGSLEDLGIPGAALLAEVRAHVLSEVQQQLREALASARQHGLAQSA